MKQLLPPLAIASRIGVRTSCNRFESAVALVLGDRLAVLALVDAEIDREAEGLTGQSRYQVLRGKAAVARVREELAKP